MKACAQGQSILVRLDFIMKRRADLQIPSRWVSDGAVAFTNSFGLATLSLTLSDRASHSDGNTYVAVLTTPDARILVKDVSKWYRYMPQFSCSLVLDKDVVAPGLCSTKPPAPMRMYTRLQGHVLLTSCFGLLMRWVNTFGITYIFGMILL